MSNLEEDKKAILDNEFLDASRNKLRLSPGLAHDPKAIVSSGADAPANPEDGQFWWDTDDSAPSPATTLTLITPNQFRNASSGNPTTYTDHDMTAHGATAGLTVAVLLMVQFKGAVATDTASFRENNGPASPSLVIYAQSTTVHQSAQGFVGVDANGIMEEAYTSATDAVTAYVVGVVNKA